MNDPLRLRVVRVCGVVLAVCLGGACSAPADALLSPLGAGAGGPAAGSEMSADRGLSTSGRESTPPGAPAVCNQVGQGAFFGCYYSDKSLGTLALTRMDAALDFDWGTGSPDPVLGNDNFSARWQGHFTFDAADYTFTATADDGVRLSVDGAMIIDKWIDQGATAYTAKKAMTAGTHLVKVEYYDSAGRAVAKLSWAKPRTYSTNFGLTENPISEGGNWINGHATGMDWTDVKISDGNATGTQVRTTAQIYDDSAAVLKGSWGPNQTVEAVVHAANQTGGGNSGFGGNNNGIPDLDPYCNKEVELILRGTITPHGIWLYEVNFSSRIDGTAYTEIGMWNGPRAVFGGYLSRRVDGTSQNCAQASGGTCGATSGDVVKATIVGNTINVYKNGVLVNTANVLINTDGNPVPPIPTGSPGVGFYSSAGCTGAAHNDDFGFRSYTATDGP